MCCLVQKHSTHESSLSLSSKQAESEANRERKGYIFFLKTIIFQACFFNSFHCHVRFPAFYNKCEKKFDIPFGVRTRTHTSIALATNGSKSDTILSESDWIKGCANIALVAFQSQPKSRRKEKRRKKTGSNFENYFPIQTKGEQKIKRIKEEAKKLYNFDGPSSIFLSLFKKYCQDSGNKMYSSRSSRNVPQFAREWIPSLC